MSVLLVTYDLTKPGQEYADLHKVLKSAPSWWHYLESTWLLVTSETPCSWYQRIQPTIDQTDRVLVIEVARNWWGQLPQDAMEWLKENVAA